MMTPTIPEQCGARAVYMGEPLVCDRERDHPGPHRGYDMTIDEPIFWPNKQPPGVTGSDGSSRGAPTTRGR